MRGTGRLLTMDKQTETLGRPLTLARAVASIVHDTSFTAP